MAGAGGDCVQELVGVACYAGFVVSERCAFVVISWFYLYGVDSWDNWGLLPLMLNPRSQTRRRAS